MKTSPCLLASLALPHVLAAPAPASELIPNVPRSLLDSLLLPTPTANNDTNLTSILTSGALPVASDLLAGVLAALIDLQPTSTPTSVPNAIAQLSALWSAESTSFGSFVSNTAQQILSGLSLGSVNDVLANYNDAENRFDNNNTVEPADTIYPKVPGSSDPEYETPESDLRGRIFIPSTFTYGAKPPVLMIPGTASRGGFTYRSNLRKLLTDVPYADPVWLNQADFNLQDIQATAETVAYALHYISAISGHANVSVITWSQGSLDIQWTLKYWSSTRALVSNVLAVSPDYHGTQVAYLICSAITSCTAGVLQQLYGSEFVRTLRAGGGDSAFVPTTNMFSSVFDQIVEPQQGADASGFLLDARGVGVTNNEIQVVCAGRPAGTFADHESMLFNPLTAALVKDALVNGGPGRVERLDLDEVCGPVIAQGLVLEDLLATESLAVVAMTLIFLAGPRFEEEPAIRGYALG